MTRTLKQTERQVCVSEEFARFLLGEQPFDGCWFGDARAPEKGRFWWRKYLRAALDTALSKQRKRK